MTSSIRSLIAASMILGVCAMATPTGTAGAQGNSDKSKVQKAQTVQKVQKQTRKVNRKAAKTSQRIGSGETWRRGRVLCNDGVWVLRSRNTCSSHGGIASHQGDFPPASDRARERANENSAVVRGRGPWADNERRGAIARCADGTYWHGFSRTGACYRHGGVAVWL